jgi:hypothetical protein
MFADNLQGRPIYFDADVDILYMENGDAIRSFPRARKVVDLENFSYEPGGMRSSVRHLVASGPFSFVPSTSLTIFGGPSTLILQDLFVSVIGANVEPERLWLWDEFCTYWRRRWGESRETFAIPDIQFLSKGEIRLLVKKCQLEFKDLELNGLFTKKGRNLDDDDMGQESDV